MRREDGLLGPYCEGYGVCAQIPWGHILKNHNSESNGEDGWKGIRKDCIYICMCGEREGIMVPFLKWCWRNFTN